MVVSGSVVVSSVVVSTSGAVVVVVVEVEVSPLGPVARLSAEHSESSLARLSRLVPALASSSATSGSTLVGQVLGLVDELLGELLGALALALADRALGAGQQVEQLVGAVRRDRPVVAAAACDRKRQNAQEQGYRAPPTHRGESSNWLWRPRDHGHCPT